MQVVGGSGRLVLSTVSTRMTIEDSEDSQVKDFYEKSELNSISRHKERAAYDKV
jgi:hypothetical protein